MISKEYRVLISRKRFNLDAEQRALLGIKYAWVEVGDTVFLGDPKEEHLNIDALIRTGHLEIVEPEIEPAETEGTPDKQGGAPSEQDGE